MARRAARHDVDQLGRRGLALGAVGMKGGRPSPLSGRHGRAVGVGRLARARVRAAPRLRPGRLDGQHPAIAPSGACRARRRSTTPSPRRCARTRPCSCSAGHVRHVGRGDRPRVARAARRAAPARAARARGDGARGQAVRARRRPGQAVQRAVAAAVRAGDRRGVPGGPPARGASPSSGRGETTLSPPPPPHSPPLPLSLSSRRARRRASPSPRRCSGSTTPPGGSR